MEKIEQKHIPDNYKEITGYNNPEEHAAYDKGREDEESVIVAWIKKWDGSTNSAMGELLDKKFKEITTKLKS